MTKKEVNGIIFPMKIPISRLPNIILKGLLDLIYPPLCQACGKKLEVFNRLFLCEVCYNNIRWINPPFCKRCGKSIGYDEDIRSVCESCKTKTYYFDSCYSVCVYEGTIRECIHKFKYNAKLALGALFTDLMTDFAEKHIDIQGFDCIIPVPLHRVKHRERTFNQAALLAASLSKKFKLPLLGNTLTRIRLDKPQIMLPKNRRLKDIKDAFKIRKSHLLKNKAVLLIDDVFTTGATVNECSRILKEAKVKKIEVLALARGV